MSDNYVYGVDNTGPVGNHTDDEIIWNGDFVDDSNIFESGVNFTKLVVGANEYLFNDVSLRNDSIKFAQEVKKNFNKLNTSLRKTISDISNINSSCDDLNTSVNDVFKLIKIGDSGEYMLAVVDDERNFITGIDTSGGLVINKITIPTNSNSEYIFSCANYKDELLFGVKQDGEFYAPKINIVGSPKIIETEEFLYAILDANNKLIFGIKNDGTVYYKSGMSNEVKDKLNIINEQLDEFHAKIADFHGGTGDWSDAKELKIPIPRCAMINLNTNILPTEKSGMGVQGVTCDIPCEMEFWDMQGNYFKKWIKFSVQGNSSRAYVKKNFGINLYIDHDNMLKDGDTFKIKFGDWVAQDSFHIKAYYTDTFRGRSVVSYMLYDQMLKTRPIFNDRPYKENFINTDFDQYTNYGYDCLTALDENFETGAKCFPMGFPVIVYQNGKFYGVYSFQLKKHRDNFMMNKKTTTHIHLDGTIDSTTLFAGADNIKWSSFEVRNPKNLYYQIEQTIGPWHNSETTSKYNGDYPRELMDINSSLYDSSIKEHVNCNKVKNYIKNFANVLPNLITQELELSGLDSSASDVDIVTTIKSDPVKLETIRSAFADRFKVSYIVDYILETNLVQDGDGYSKNWQWTTWDGHQWVCNPYDMDCTFGGNHLGLCQGTFGHYVQGKGNKTLPTNWIWNYFTEDWVVDGKVKVMGLKNRWKQLRDLKVFDTDNIVGLLRDWIDRIGYDNFKAEYKKWNESPCNRESYINTNYWSLVEFYQIKDYNSETRYKTDNVCVKNGRVYKSILPHNIIPGAENINHDPETNSDWWKDVTWDPKKPYYEDFITYYSSYGVDGDSTSDFELSDRYYAYAFKCTHEYDVDLEVNPDGDMSKAPITKFYNAFPRELGCYDSIYRVYCWIKYRIEYLDSVFNYNN